MKADPKRFIVGPMVLKDDAKPVLTVDALRQQLQNGNAKLLGEITAQYVGLKPDDPVLAPYWKLAEELDVPL